jgi:hypothetical protein
MKTRTSGARSRQLALNGSNGLAPSSTERPFVTLFEAGADPEIPTEERRIMSAKISIRLCDTHRQCHRLYAGIVRIVGYVKAEFGAHGEHGGIL